MTLRARFSLPHSELSGFLFASVGDETNGMPLSVISALTRLGVDPWDKAARLAALLKVRAAEALAPMIAQFSIGRSSRSDDVAVARRLAGLLPMHDRAASPGREPASKGIVQSLQPLMFLVCVILAAAILFARM